MNFEKRIEKAAEARKISKTMLWLYWIPAASAIFQNIYRNREKINDTEVTREAFYFKDINVG